MNKIVFLISVCLMMSTLAFSQQKQTHKRSEENSSNSSNDFMHQSSTEDLIQIFESPERDAYQQPQKVLDYLGPLVNKTIMDIGAGSGYFSVKLADKGAKVIAADVSEEFQNALKKRIKQ